LQQKGGKTMIRSFRVADDLWHKAKLKAIEQDTTITAVLVQALREFVKE